MKTILVKGRDNEGEILMSGTITFDGTRMVVTPEADPPARKMTLVVTKHDIYAGRDKPMLKPGTPEWSKALPRGGFGATRLRCERAARHA